MLKENNIRTDDFDSYEESTIEPSGFFTDGRRTTIRKILEKDGDSDGENKQKINPKISFYHFDDTQDDCLVEYDGEEDDDDDEEEEER
jgi:hypothetical protein